VLFMRNAIFMLVCLNKFVIYVVSFPMYVNVTHFCFCVWWSVSVFVVWGGMVYVVVLKRSYL
jgi:hypothetical protein